jgi:hypothetical protein
MAEYINCQKPSPQSPETPNHAVEQSKGLLHIYGSLIGSQNAASIAALQRD